MMKHAITCLVVLLASAICLPGCKTMEYYPVGTVRIDTVYIQKAQMDSVLVRDSVHIYLQGDTVKEYRYKYIYRYKNRTDTLYLARTDSVSVPYPVEKKLTAWQQAKVSYGGWAIGIVFVTILTAFGWLVYKLRKWL